MPTLGGEGEAGGGAERLVYPAPDLCGQGEERRRLWDYLGSGERRDEGCYAIVLRLMLVSAVVVTELYAMVSG